MSKTSIKTRPELWERVKKEVIRSPKGGPSGKWSARKAQRAVAIYKARGGGYKGKKSPSNSLAKWSREKWGYINETNKKSGKTNKKSKRLSRKSGSKKSKRKSVKYGRYLPLEVRKRLTEKEKREENRRKGKKYGEWVPYSKSVTKKLRKVLNKSTGK